jgi:hypothetical protein
LAAQQPEATPEVNQLPANAAAARNARMREFLQKMDLR